MSAPLSNPTPAPEPVNTPAPAPELAPAPSATPSGLFATPEEKAWAESKGWKADDKDLAPKVVESYKNLEKMWGADKAGRTVMLPKDAEDKAAIDTIFTKLGKPADANGYSIELPEGADPTFANTAREQFHKLNLTKDQGEGVAQWYRAVELDYAQKAEAQIKADEAALRTEWGDKFDTHRETARAAAKAAGLSDDDVERMIGTLGVAKGTKALEFFGRNYIESGPPDTGRTNVGFGNLTPATAASKVDQLYADKNFMERMGHSDPKIREAAMMEMDALQRVAVNNKRV